MGNRPIDLRLHLPGIFWMRPMCLTAGLGLTKRHRTGAFPCNLLKERGLCRDFDTESAGSSQMDGCAGRKMALRNLFYASLGRLALEMRVPKSYHTPSLQVSLKRTALEQSRDHRQPPAF